MGQHPMIGIKLETLERVGIIGLRIHVGQSALKGNDPNWNDIR
jgi:hypothetical protein